MIVSQSKSTVRRPWLDQDATPQIQIEAVSKTYGAATAVDDISLQIYKGEMFALVGASGCGKTTLLRMLAGFVTPSSGRICIDRVDMGSVPPHERPVWCSSARSPPVGHTSSPGASASAWRSRAP
jgi:putrescine transport system ATP-binding protein